VDAGDVDLHNDKVAKVDESYLVGQLATTIINTGKVEALARMLHEAGREAVSRGLVVRTDMPVRPFVEWDALTPAAQEGRRVQARWLRVAQWRGADVTSLLT
jgi:hypothetical protein